MHELIGNKPKHVLLCGDFNCPDTDWDQHTVHNNAPDQAVQQALIDLATKFSLSQVHDSATREGNLLDLVFTTNPSLVKASNNTPGISDHDIVVTDIDLKPHYVRQKPRKSYRYDKAVWNSLRKEASSISEDIKV